MSVLPRYSGYTRGAHEPLLTQRHSEKPGEKLVSVLFPSHTKNGRKFRAKRNNRNRLWFLRKTCSAPWQERGRGHAVNIHYTICVRIK